MSNFRVGIQCRGNHHPQGHLTSRVDDVLCVSPRTPDKFSWFLPPFTDDVLLTVLFQISALKEAGGEARLFDWNEKGRPLWADTSESVQIIDTKSR